MRWPFHHHPHTPVGPPPPTPLRAVAVVVPSAGAWVLLDDVIPPGPHEGITNATGYVEFVVSDLSISRLVIEAPSYRPYVVEGLVLPPGNVQIRVGVEADPSRPHDVLLGPLVPVVPPRPQPVPRSPLPPFPPGSYARELPWTPPLSRDFLRGDSWGVTLPGAPWVPGASSRHPERILSWFLDRYPSDWRSRYLDQYAKDGYTHLKLSYADSCGPLDNGPNSPPGAGRSLDQFIETCLEVGKVIPYRHVMIGSKYFQPANMSAQQWADFADPIMDALIAAGAVDEFCLGWEWNFWNEPGRTTIDAFKHAGQKAHAAGLSFWMHFSTHVTSWFKDQDPRGRFGFYDDIGTDVDGINYQTDPNWDLDMLQARIVDSLWQFGTQGNRHKFRMDEDSASLMWDNDKPDEDDANLRGFVACCTTDNVWHTDAKVWGFGNGARRPDGTVL